MKKKKRKKAYICINMGRHKIDNKNKPISISLPQDQIQFIQQHPKFNLSKMVQIHLSEYISLSNEVDRIKKEENINGEETIK